MLKAVDAAPVTRRQKLQLYKAGIYMSTADMAIDCPRTLHHLGGAAVRFVKKCGGLAKSANTYSSPIPPPENEWPELTLPVCPLQAAPSLKTVPATDIS